MRSFSDTTMGFKLKKDRFRLDITNKFCTLRVMRLVNRLFREIVETLSLKVFEASLDGALSNLVWCKVYLVCLWLVGL